MNFSRPFAFALLNAHAYSYSKYLYARTTFEKNANEYTKTIDFKLLLFLQFLLTLLIFSQTKFSSATSTKTLNWPVVHAEFFMVNQNHAAELFTLLRSRSSSKVNTD